MYPLIKPGKLDIIQQYTYQISSNNRHSRYYRTKHTLDIILYNNTHSRKYTKFKHDTHTRYHIIQQ